METINARDIALDLETHDPLLKKLGPGWAFYKEGIQLNDKGGFPCGYALSWRDETSGELCSEYLPVRHWGGNLELGTVRSRLGPILSDPRRRIIAANATYDYGWTKADGFEWKAETHDVQIQGPLLDENRFSYSLDALAKTYLGDQKKSSSIYDVGKEWGYKNVFEHMKDLPGGLVEEYARQDAELTVRLFEKLDPMMREQDLMKVYNVETRLIPMLHDMRKRGVRVDLDKANELHVKYTMEETKLFEELHQLTGQEIDPWRSAVSIKWFLEAGVSEDDFPRTPKKRELSLDADFLGALSEREGDIGLVAARLLRYRRVQKMRSTFVENMIQGHSYDGRIHCQLNALRSDDGGTVSGRFSSSDPNLQQVPARDPEFGPEIRSMFLPEEGETWASIDYSSQEPRLAVHFGFLCGIDGAAELVQAFNEDPRLDAYLFTAEACGVTRKQAKTIRLGILYGMGGGKLCEDLGLPFDIGTWKGREVKYAGEEGKALIERFHRNSPMDKKLSEYTQSVAVNRNYVRTVLGRRSRFPRRENGEVWFAHKALNRIIQGSAADMMKLAMVNLYDNGVLPLLTVHDELCFSVASDEQIRFVLPFMQDSIPLEVPIVCDVEVGPNWGKSMLNEAEGIYWEEYDYGS